MQCATGTRKWAPQQAVVTSSTATDNDGAMGSQSSQCTAKQSFGGTLHMSCEVMSRIMCGGGVHNVWWSAMNTHPAWISGGNSLCPDRLAWPLFLRLLKRLIDW